MLTSPRRSAATGSSARISSRRLYQRGDRRPRADRRSPRPWRDRTGPDGVILGINAFHADSAACLIREGKLVAAAEEERFRRIKHWAGFPSEAIAYCLREAGISIGDVDHVAVNQDSRANQLKKIAYVLGQRPDLGLSARSAQATVTRAPTSPVICWPERFRRGAVRAQIHAIEHHLAHLSSAFDVSPFDEAVVVSVDGFGDFASTAWGVGRGDALEVEGRIHFPHSLGVFLSGVDAIPRLSRTTATSTRSWALRPTASPGKLEQMRKIVRLKPDGAFELDLTYFRHHREQASYQWQAGSPVFADLFSPALEDLLGPRRHDALKIRSRIGTAISPARSRRCMKPRSST